METDVRTVLLREVALEGLDGITINCLWIRLKELGEQFPIAIDERSKSYLWNFIVHYEDLQFFELPEPRPELIPYNRFHYVDPESGVFVEDENIPEEIYPIHVIGDNGIQGSCPMYDSRKDVTAEVRGQALVEVVQRWGEKLIVVASHQMRRLALVGPKFEPTYSFTDLTYAILERIGRSRYMGELSVGKKSIQVFNEKQKTIFYHVLKLVRLGLVRKQTIQLFRVEKKAKIYCKLFHLTPFFREVCHKQKELATRLCDYLEKQPGKRDELSKCRAHLNIGDTAYKKLVQAIHKYVTNILLPFREFYPDATPKEFLTKGGMERTIRLSVLIKHPRETDSDEEDEEIEGEEEEEGEEEDDKGSTVSGLAVFYERSGITQALMAFKQAGPKGLSQSDLKHILGLDKLESRFLCKHLHRLNYITSITLDIGKQKKKLYVAREMLKDSKIHQEYSAEFSKLDKFISASGQDSSTIDQDKCSLLEDEKEGTEKETLAEEDLAVIVEEDETEIMKMNDLEEKEPMDVTIIETPDEEMQGLKSFSMLSDKHLRRANWVLEVVQSVKLIDHISLTKTIREKEKAMNLPHLMDNKSLQRILSALVSEKKIRSIKTVLQLGSRQKNLHFLCSLDVKPSDEIVKKNIEQAKLRSFHVKKEQLKIAAVKREKQANKMYLESVSEPARVGILKLQEYRQLLKGKSPDMKYNRKKAGEYGALPKMAKIHCLHSLLLYVCYETYGQPNIENSKNQEGEMEEVTVETDGTDKSMKDIAGNDGKKTESSSQAELSDMKQKKAEAEAALALFDWWKNLKEPPIYKDEMSWKRYLPPVPCHKGYPAGWCFVSDLLLYLPLCVFCQIVNVCYDIEGLLEMLAHPIVKYYPIMNLPFKLAQQLLHAKKYIYSFFEVCVYMCEMGLLSFGPQIAKEKDKVFIYLHKKATLLDTRRSLPGYTKTRVPEGEVFEEKTFDLLTEQGVTSYWEDLQIIALGSNLSMISKSSEEQEDTESHEVLPLEQTLLHKTPDMVEDNGVLPGDRRGAAGLDSAIFCHRRNNWTTKTFVWNSKIYQHKWDRPISIPDTQRASDENRSRRLPRLAPSDLLTLKMASETELGVQNKTTQNVKGNKGGKGIKRKAVSFDTNIASKRLKRKVKKTPVEGYKKLRDFKRKKPFEKGDEKDRLLYSRRHQHRVAWTAQEDSLLLVCRIASYLMDRKRRQMVIPYTVIRDILHANFPGIAENKTSQACNRRLVFVQKNPQTQQNISLFLETALRDQSIVERFASRQYILTDPTLPDIFKELVNVLVEKFRSMDIGIIELPASLSELSKKYELEMINTSLKTTKVYKDITCKEDICKAVLHNVLHGTVLVKDKQGRSHELFKLLTQYPEGMLSDVVKDMRSDGFLVFNKASTRTNLPSGLGLKNLKASQRYFYHFLHRMPNVIFEESLELLYMLRNKYGETQGDRQIRLPERYKGGQIALLASLILEKEINITCTVPEMLVKVDLESVKKFPFGRGKAFQTAKLLHSEGDREEEEEDEDERDILLKDIEPADTDENTPDKNQMDQSNTGSSNEIAVSTTASEATSKPSAETSEDHEGGESSNQEGIGENQGMPPIMQTVYNSSSTMVFEGTAGKSRNMEREFKSAFASRTLICMTRCDDISMEDIFVFNAQDNFVVNSCSAEIVLRGRECGQPPEILEEMNRRADVVEQMLKDCQKTLPFKLDLEVVWQKMRNANIPEADIVKIQKIYQLLASAKELGMTFYGIKAACDDSQLEQWLDILIDHNAVSTCNPFKDLFF